MKFSKDDARSIGASLAVHVLLLMITILWVMETPRANIPEVIELALIAPSKSPQPPKPVQTRQTTRRQSAVQSTNAPATRSAQPRTSQNQASTRQDRGATTIPSEPQTPRGMDRFDLPEFGGGNDYTKSSPEAGTERFGREDGRERDVPTFGRTGDSRAGMESDNAQITSDPGQLSSTPATASNIDWGMGPSRNRIAGVMPEFPSGVTREATIKVRFTVKPDGSVRNITFIQKGEPAFENAVLRAMRTWKFNALPSSMEQADQNALATFRFELK